MLYLPVLFFVLLGLAEFGRRQLGTVGESMVLLVLAAFVSTMAFSASYSPYGADMAAPTAFEALTMTCLAAAILALWQRQRGLLFGFVVVGYLARPTALLLVTLLAIAAVVTLAADVRRRVLRDTFLALLSCVGIFMLYEQWLIPNLTDGSAGYLSTSIIDRFNYIRFADLRRFEWVMIPGGGLPFLSLFAFRRQDPFTRMLALVVVMYFLFFLPPAFVALHHFVPVMVLPAVVYLRSFDTAGAMRLGAVGCAIGFALTLPVQTNADREQRALGRRMVFDLGSYGGAPGPHRQAIKAREVIFELFPANWDVPDADVERIGLAHSLLHYSMQYGTPLDEADYVIRPADIEAPSGFTEVGRRDGAVAYARDLGVLADDRRSAPGRGFGNPRFVVPRETLFYFIGVPGEACDLNLRAFVGRRRENLRHILARLTGRKSP